MKQAFKSIHKVHDQFFKASMVDKRVLIDFLKAHLPSDLCQLIDFNVLELQKDFFIACMGWPPIDVLYKTKMADREAYVYFLREHQSSAGSLLPFRIVDCTCHLIDLHLKKYKKIPLVYPIVVYHGTSPYPDLSHLHNLLDAPKELVQRYLLKPFQLVELGRIDDCVMKKNLWSGVMALALKHVFADDLLVRLQDMAASLRQLNEEGGRGYLGIVLKYLLNQGHISDKGAFAGFVASNISKDLGPILFDPKKRS